MDPLTFHPGNSKDFPCAAPPSDTDTLHWPGDLGKGFHLCKRKCLRTTLAVKLWFISAFRKLKEWQHALLIYFDRLRFDSLQWPLFDGVLCVLNCEGKLDFIRENSFSILSSQVRRTLLYSLLISFAIKISSFSRYLRKIGKNRTYLK